MIKAFVFDNKEFVANTYVIGKKGEKCVVVDLGSTSSEVSDFVRRNFEGVSAILLTHGHYDHIRGVSKFIKAMKKEVPVYIHKDDEEMLLSDELNRAVFHGEKVAFDFKLNLVNDGYVLDFNGEHFKVIHTPFHTRGSSCFLLEEDNAIFTGDTLFKNGIGRFDFANSEPDKVHSSLMKLVNLADTLVCYPGHGEITTLKAEKENNPYFRG